MGGFITIDRLFWWLVYNLVYTSACMFIINAWVFTQVNILGKDLVIHPTETDTPIVSDRDRVLTPAEIDRRISAKMNTIRR